MIVDVKFHDRPVQEGFRNMDARTRRIRATFRKLQRPLRENLREHADAQESPATGNKWPRRAEPTERRSSKRARTIRVNRERRRRGMSGPLREQHVRRPEPLGSLPETVAVTASGLSLVAKSAVRRWSTIHNEGGIAGHGAVIPQREFLAFDERGFLVPATEFLLAAVAGGFE